MQSSEEKLSTRARAKVFEKENGSTNSFADDFHNKPKYIWRFF
jgi:hypothetical protein